MISKTITIPFFSEQIIFMKYIYYGNLASPDWIIPTMTPKSPRALPKISITRIFTKVSGF